MKRFSPRWFDVLLMTIIILVTAFLYGRSISTGHVEKAGQCDAESLRARAAQMNR